MRWIRDGHTRWVDRSTVVRGSCKSIVVGVDCAKRHVIHETGWGSITILHAMKSNDGWPREIVPPGTSRNADLHLTRGVFCEVSSKNREVFDQKMTAEIARDGRKGELMDLCINIFVNRLFRFYWGAKLMALKDVLRWHFRTFLISEPDAKRKCNLRRLPK